MTARRRGVLGAAAWLALLGASPAAAQQPRVRVQVIDRGQADGILIRTPNERWVVIDAGTDRQQAESMAGNWRVDSVALVIVSHRHRDHFGGMDEVLEAFPVGRFVGHLGDCPGTDADDTIRAISSRRGIPTQDLGADTIVVDGVRFIILPPDPDDDPCPREENNNSVVVRMEFGAFSMLFTGDAETAQREWLMEHHRDLLDVAVLKASHHGSRNGADGMVNGRTWLDHVTPQAVVISAGVHRGFKHPHAETVDAYSAAVGDALHCTNRHGTVRVYAFADGSFRIRRQFSSDRSCAYDGT